MDITIENLIIPASIDQNSLKLGRLPDLKIRTAAIRDERTARRGFMDTIVCTVY
jgi:hypothetical protein